jgi:glycosyltransferase involved in cell wall biosynthesis
VWCETLVNNGGIIGNLRQAPWKWLLVPGFLLSTTWAAWRLLRRSRPDIVHAHWLLPQGFIAALLSRFDRWPPPLVVTCHGSDLHALNGSWLQMAKRFVARGAASMTVVSSAMLAQLERAGIDPRVAVIAPMGVDLADRFRPNPETVRQRREILSVGRLVHGKGVARLVEVMVSVVKKHPDARLVIAGSGPEEDALRARVAALQLQEHVRFLGAVPQAQLPMLYQQATVFVAPFTPGVQEGLGLVVVEAAACGCPVVVGDLPAMREIVSDGTIGTLVPVDDAAALADAVCAVLDGPGETFEQALERARAVARFDWAQCADAYAGLLASQVRT